MEINYENNVNGIIIQKDLDTTKKVNCKKSINLFNDEFEKIYDDFSMLKTIEKEMFDENVQYDRIKEIKHKLAKCPDINIDEPINKLPIMQ